MNPFEKNLFNQKLSILNLRGVYFQLERSPHTLRLEKQPRVVPAQHYYYKHTRPLQYCVTPDNDVFDTSLVKDWPAYLNQCLTGVYTPPGIDGMHMYAGRYRIFTTPYHPTILAEYLPRGKIYDEALVMDKIQVTKSDFFDLGIYRRHEGWTVHTLFLPKDKREKKVQSYGISTYATSVYSEAIQLCVQK